MPDVDLVPTEEMAEAAARGLALRKKHNRGGTAVGVARARDIKNRTELSPETVKRMVAFFDRHEKNKAGGENDAGYIAWLLWGGDPGRAWANRKVKELERKQENGMSAKSKYGDVGSNDNKIRYLLGEATSAMTHNAGDAIVREFVGKAEALIEDKTPIALRQEVTRIKYALEVAKRNKKKSSRPGEKATMATKPKDPAAALKAMIAEARKIGVSSYALDIATYRAQAAMTAAEVATLARDLKAAIEETKARKKAEAAAQAAAAEQRVQALIPKRGVVGRAVDRARTAVATLTTKTVDPTSATYTDALAGAKERGKAAVLAYKQAATAHAAALARLDKYVAHAAQSIAGAQSAKDVAHFLSAIEAATRTRAVAARSMPTPFSRSGAKARFTLSDVLLDAMAVVKNDEPSAGSFVDEATKAMTRYRDEMTANDRDWLLYKKLIALAERKGIRIGKPMTLRASRPGAKAKVTK